MKTGRLAAVSVVLALAGAISVCAQGEAPAAPAAAAGALSAVSGGGVQGPPPVSGPVSVGPGTGSFQASVTRGSVSAQPVNLSLDGAIQRGLQANLGMILSGTQTAAARAAQLTQLQSLLPAVNFTARETAMQVDLAAEGLRLPGFPSSHKQLF